MFCPLTTTRFWKLWQTAYGFVVHFFGECLDLRQDQQCRQLSGNACEQVAFHLVCHKLAHALVQLQCYIAGKAVCDYHICCTGRQFPCFDIADEVHRSLCQLDIGFQFPER